MADDIEVRSGKFNIEVQKKARYFQAFEITLDDTVTPVTLVDKTVKCVIKESYETDDALFELTEANGGLQILSASGGRFAIELDASDTDVEVDYGVYNIIVINDNDPDDVKPILGGKVKFMESTV